MNAIDVIEQIKAQAKAKGLSRYRIARDIGTSDAQVKSWFDGRVFPTLQKLVALCDAVGLKIELKEK